MCPDRCLLARSVEPLSAFALIPEPFPDLAVLHDVLASSMLSVQSGELREVIHARLFLLAECPFTLVLPSISPDVNAVAMLLVELVLAFVASTILPRIEARPVHVVVQPLAL